MDNLFRKEVLDNKSRFEGEVSLALPQTLRNFYILICLLSITLLFFSMFFTYTKSKTVKGTLEYSSGVTKLLMPKDGVIVELLVDESDEVDVGQLIARIESKSFVANGKEVNSTSINELSKQLANIQKEISNAREHLLTNQARLELEKENLSLTLGRLRKKSNLLKTREKNTVDIIKQYDELSKTGYFSKIDLQKQKDLFLELQLQINSNELEIQSSNHKYKLLNNQYKSKQISLHDKIIKLESGYSELLILLLNIEESHALDIYAPVGGVVSGLIVKQNNFALKGDTLLSIVPNENLLQAALYIPTDAYGFIKKGQLTKLRYDAFPYQVFGSHHGTVNSLSNSLVLPEELEHGHLIEKPSYKAVIKLEHQSIKNQDEKLQIKAGMIVEAEIILEEMRLIDWVISFFSSK